MGETMAHNMVGTLVDDNGYNIDSIASVAVAAGPGTTVIKNGPGRLNRVLLTTASGTAPGVLTFYDSVGAASGTILAIVPVSTAAGTAYDIRMPAAVGITAVGTTNSGAATVAYS